MPYTRPHNIARRSQSIFSTHLPSYPVHFVLLIVVLLLSVFQFAQATTVGSGSYRDGGATPAPVDATYITSNITGPIPSNDWWTSVVMKQYSDGLYAFPLAYKCYAGGIEVDYPGAGSFVENGNLDWVLAGFVKDFSLEGDSLDPTTFYARLDDYSDWTVDIQLTDDSTNYFTLTLTHGSPYGYATFAGCEPVIKFATAIDWVFDDSGSTITFPCQGDHIGVEAGGKYYGLFAPSSSTWTKTGDTINVTLGNDKDFFSYALMTGESDLSYFYQHAYAFVTNTTVSWDYDQSLSKVNTTYTIQTELKKAGMSSDTLICLFPHHWRHSAKGLTSISYQTLRGELKLSQGNSFTTQLDFHGIIPYFLEPEDTGGPYPYNKAHLQALVDNAESMTFAYWGTYGSGKELGKWARIIPVADAIGDETAKNYFVNGLRNRTSDWYTYSPPETNKYFCYFSTPTKWGGLIGYTPDYNLENFDDHHFHYGYFVYASAILGIYDSSFIDDYGGMVELLIKDYACPDRNDTMFPFLRCFDIYEGHSWADGYGDDIVDRGNNQESSSEAINSWVGIYLWGLVTGNEKYRDLGIWGYVTEISAIDEYWFDKSKENFLTDYRNDENIMAALVWGGVYEHKTWFSPEPECIHGIQYIPVTPQSIYLAYDKSYAQDDYDHMVLQNGGTENEFQWYDIIWKFQSLFDPDTVLAKYDDTKAANSGNTWAETYSFIHNMRTLGDVDTSIYADYPTYGVFIKGGERTYIAYNPSLTQTLKVSFYSPSYLGYLEVPPNTVKASKSLSVDEDEEQEEEEEEQQEQQGEFMVYPNPCHLNRGEVVHFKNLPKDSVLSIYNIAGELVYKSGKISSSSKEWPGINDRGKIVASGVYIYIVDSEEKSYSGKIIILK